MAVRSRVHGRKQLIEEIGELVRGGEARLITLTGLAGVGKTRVMQAVIESTQVGLDPIETPVTWIDAYRIPSGELLSAIADGVGTRAGVRSADDEVGATLDAVRRTVVIDGVDSASDAADVIDRLLASTESTRFVVTRRTPLRLAGERVVRVEPLPTSGGDIDTLASLPSVRVFLDIAAELGFDLSDDPAALVAIAAIARRLGGLPGAIELAASRVAVFSPSTMLDLLDKAPVSEVLAGSEVDSELFLAISWTVSLLDPAQRRLLVNMAIFAGPVPVDAVAAVVGRSLGTVIDEVSDLVDMHLLVVDHSRSTSTFALHSLVREHVAAMAGTGRCESDLEDAYEHWALDLAAGSDRAGGVDASVVLVVRDLVVVLRRLLERGDADGAASIAAVIGPVWLSRGVRASDAEVMAEVAASAAAVRADPGLRALVTAWSAMFEAERAVVTGDAVDVVAVRDDALALAEHCDERTRLAVMGVAVQTARIFDDREVAVRLCDEGLELARQCGDAYNQARFEIWAGMLAHQTGRLQDAVAMGEVALSTARRIGDPSLIINAAGLLLTLPPDAGVSVALPAAVELVRLAHEIDDPRSLLWLQPVATAEALRDGDHGAAAGLIVEHLTSTRAIAAWNFGAISLLMLAQLAAARGDDERAAWLHGIVSGRLDLIRPSMPARAVAMYERSIELVREQLGDERFAATAAPGSLLSIEDAQVAAVEYARSVIESVGQATDTAAPPAESSLTARESEVLERLVAGDRNKDIALRLGITPKTAMHHTSSIYRKLGVRGRSQAVAWALRGPARSLD